MERRAAAARLARMMRRPFPLVLVPAAYLTLAFANPFGGMPSAIYADEGSKQVAPPATDKAKDGEKPKEKGNAKTSKAPADPSGFKYGRKEPLPKKPGTVRLAAYNLENLFDDQDDPALSGEFEDKTMTTPPERLAALAATIKALDADVLAVEEVESKECLTAFRDHYLKGLGYDYLASVDAGDRRGIEQSVLSRYPIVEVANWPSEHIDDMRAKETGEGWSTPADGKWPERWARSPLMVRVKSPQGYELTLFVVHHKASKEFDAQRELEGLQVLEFVRERLAKHPDENLAILGDFNNSPSKKSIKVYAESSDPKLTNAYDDRFDTKAPSDTYLTHASGRPIDFIFMSRGLAKDAVPGTFFVLGTPIGAKADSPKPKGYASDHFPVAIDLTPDAKPAR